MSGLMMIFLFVAISYMSNLELQAKHVRQIAVAYQEMQDSLYEELLKEFRDDLTRWHAEIDRKSLSVRFVEPEVLFNQGSAEVTPRFREILDEFFPRYMRIIYSDDYRTAIEEIRIEGHTSSEWGSGAEESTAYFQNMELSQDRTRSVLIYCMSLLQASDQQQWARRFVTANGLSSSKPILDDSGKEQPDRSRRVEFRTKTAAETKIVQVIEAIRAEE